MRRILAASAEINELPYPSQGQCRMSTPPRRHLVQYDLAMKCASVLVAAICLAACTSTTVSTSDVETTTTSGAVPTTDGVVTTTVAGTSTTVSARSTVEILDSLGAEPCPESEFTCVTLEMPLDHFDPSNPATIDVVFAVLPSGTVGAGAFLTVTGGPGSSGIASADSYLSYYDPAIAETFDTVFFDPRGIASSGGLTCPSAATDYYRADGDVHTPGGINALVTAASIFVADCVAEMGDPVELGFVSTAQVVEDIEVFRQTLGYEELVIFGESYGTQVGQTYAAAHGDVLDRLIIDGVVDLTLDTYEYHRQMAAASSSTLDSMLARCDEDDGCSADMSMPAREAYGRLAAELVEEPTQVAFPLPDGAMETRHFGLGELEVAAAGSLYTEYDRMMFNRAVAAYAGRGDLVPLLRLAYINLVVDPATLEPIEDPTWSDAMYFAVECLDYAFDGASPEEKVEAILSGAAGTEGLTLGSVYYGDLPCAFWPHVTEEARPDPLVAPDLPVLVLGSTVDPVTPHHQGVDVHSRLADGHIISKEGGPHVIFGWGEECPDVEVTAFILDGTPPETDLCQGEVVGEYVPLFPESLPADPNVLLDLVEWELTFHPDYYYWDGVTPTSIGCGNGGTWSMSPTDVGEHYRFDDCELADGLVLDGTGTYHYDDDVFALEVTIDGCRHVYTRDPEGHSLGSGC